MVTDGQTVQAPLDSLPRANAASSAPTATDVAVSAFYDTHHVVEYSRAMPEEPFSVSLSGGLLQGHRGGEGEPALLLHGGPALPDYLDRLAAELADLFTTIRYTQRGTPPSTLGPPYTIDSHMADVLAVCDALGVERAWAIGHSWGGHLALHLLVSYPGRLRGVICIDPLGARGEIFAEFGENLRRGLSEQQVARLDEIEARRRQGEASEADLPERFEMIWPRYFAEPASAPPNPATQIGVQCSSETNASISEHFERETLLKELPDARLPVLFVHGLLDPLPLRSSTDTASLIPGAIVETIAGCGHFPWLERPGEFKRLIERFLAQRAKSWTGAGLERASRYARVSSRGRERMTEQSGSDSLREQRARFRGTRQARVPGPRVSGDQRWPRARAPVETAALAGGIIGKR